MPTRVQIRTEAGRELGSLFNSAGSVAATTVVDAPNLQDSTAAAERHVGSWLYRPDRAAADILRRVSLFAPSSGTLTQSGANYSNTSDLVYELHYRLDPVELNRCIDRALRSIRYRAEYRVTMVSDGDMETSGTGQWTASGSAIAKGTTVANVYRGAQSLQVTDSGSALGFARTASIPVIPGRTYYAAGVCRANAAGATCRLQAYDVTNSASIQTADNPTQRWQVLAFQLTTPATCELMQMRLITVEASAVTHWDDIDLIEEGRRRYPLPTWLTRRAQIENVISRHEWGETLGTDRYQADAPSDETWGSWTVEGEARGTGTSALNLLLWPPTYAWKVPVVRAVRNYEALATDADATPTSRDYDLDWVAAGTLMHAWRIIRANSEGLEREYAAAELAYWGKKWTQMCRDYQPAVTRRILPPFPD